MSVMTTNPADATSTNVANSETAGSETTGPETVTTSRTNMLSQLSAAKLWRSTAPKAVQEAWKKSDHDLAWEAWQKHLASRKASKTITKLFNEKINPLTWGVDTDEVAFFDWLSSIDLSNIKLSKPKLSNIKKSLASKASNSLEGQLSAWIEVAATCTPSIGLSREMVALAYSLPELASHCSQTTWWALADLLIQTATEASVAANYEEAEPEQIVTEQLLAGELPLVLSVALPELQPAKELLSVARRNLSESLDQLTDGEGLITSELLEAAPLLFACWTRCRAMGEELSKGSWSSEAETQYEWLIEQILRLSDRQLRLPFAAEASCGMLPAMKMALSLSGNASDYVAASKRLKGFKAEKATVRDAPEPSNDSEWATLATLAAGWSDKSPRITVDYSDENLRLEIVSGGELLISGDWPVDVTRDGQSLAPTDEWESSCWHSDEDCDYLELSIPLSDGSTLERLFLLAREDGVAMISEMLLSDDEEHAKSKIKLQTSLTMSEGLHFAEEDETRDASLIRSDKMVAGIMPLALPEWRVEKRVGELIADGKKLRLSAEGTGENLASPIWIDFSAKRFAKQRTWRQLAVGESLKKVTDDVAVGYRIQSGKDQWLVYRSLAPPSNRTLLGQNFSGEAIYGRFLKTGEVDEYLEIDDNDE